jgi:hypothetical protein
MFSLTTRWGTQDHSSSVVCLSLHGRKILSAYFLISQRGDISGTRDLRLLIHRFPTLIRGHLDLLSFLPPSHTPFPRQKSYSTSEKIPRCGTTCWVTHGMGLLGKETSHCQYEDRGSSLTLSSSVYICQVTTLINYKLQTLGYQQEAGLLNSWLITKTPYWKFDKDFQWLIVDNKDFIDSW